MINYTKPLSEFDYGHLMTVRDFIDDCDSTAFIDYDGFGYAVKDNMVDVRDICPSVRDTIPKDATHIIWFNR